MGKGFKRRRRRNDHGVDDWLMTYADMITLLLCFFAIFLSVSVPKEDQMEQAKQKVLEHFAAPDKLRGETMPRIDTTGNPRENVPYDALPSIIDEYHSGEGRSVGDGIDAGEGQSQGMGEGEAQHEVRIDPAAIPRIDLPFDHVTAYEEQQEDGDRITIIEMPSAAFFASGSAELSAEGKVLLRRVRAESLADQTLKDYIVTIEGHTDDIPISTLQFPSNWELSTARAASVVKYLIELGVAPQRLRVAGYADVHPKVPNDSPENRAQNRRVVVKLEKLERRTR